MSGGLLHESTVIDDELEQRAAWLRGRRRGIGASDVSGILGLSPWSSPWKVWADKVGLIEDTPPSEAMEFGLMAEEMLARYFTKRTGLFIHGEQTVVVHATEDWMRCTLDGWVHEGVAGANPLGIYEAKTTSDPPDVWEREVPLHYQTQAGWSMAVTGTEHCWFGVLHLAFGRPQFRVYEFHRDPIDEASMIAACKAFWHDHVVTGEPPPVDGTTATTEAIRDAYNDPDPDGCVDVADHPGLLYKLKRIGQWKADIKHLESNVAEYENAVKVAIADRTTLTNGTDLKGRPCVVASWKTQDRTDLDRAALKAAHPDLVEQFTTTRPIRVLRIRSDKEES